MWQNIQNSSMFRRAAGGILLLGAALLIGCGAKTPPTTDEKVDTNVQTPTEQPREAKVIDERVDVIEQMIAHYDKVTDKASYDQELPVIKELLAKHSKLCEEFNGLSDERKEAANRANPKKEQLANERLGAAKNRARKAVAAAAMEKAAPESGGNPK